MEQIVKYRDNARRYFFDTEFIEDGDHLELLSIGMVDDVDGREIYCVNGEADLSRANEWVQKNVLPHLGGSRMKRREIRNAMESFFFTDRPIEMWSYYADTDWVLLYRLWGGMMKMPPFMPQMCMDLKQLSIELGNPRHPAQAGVEHNALDDAKWHRELYHFLRGVTNQ